ncbi:MAG: thiaminase II [Rhodospirillales bacterium]|jgi:thiaminase/transcriptional activator TenA|nr:thiaminase II [Rhodospirillaceae bacterium]MDP6430330.1 thiaminase II [Rhodospirillales bacterium]MDP6646050.1 thiaminase II [Rhodospirillales bacterium]MDP6841159.1 thiaminase II [Rhodospirillales bacterium]|tara:strand:+ start:4600 stop:5262 length:663 start_codon:yes stop_codon:yes gene_type:complete
MVEALFDRLKAAGADDWDAYIHHPFVAGLADGTLPEASFRHYLGQDYLFLIHFARAYALAAYKSSSLDEIRQAAQGLSTIVDMEMDLHVEFCASWGLTEADMEALPEAAETMAYTRFVLETGLAGDALDLHVALAPCIVGYAEIGAELATAASDDNPYAAWIHMYASDDYQAAAAAERRHLDALFEARAGEGRMSALTRIFNQATRLECAFWQMGLDAGA